MKYNIDDRVEMSQKWLDEELLEEFHEEMRHGTIREIDDEASEYEYYVYFEDDEEGYWVREKDIKGITSDEALIFN